MIRSKRPLRNYAEMLRRAGYGDSIQDCREDARSVVKLTFALSTQRAVCELILRDHGTKIPARAYGEYLERWGYAPQQPAPQAYEQNPKAVKDWIAGNARRICVSFRLAIRSEIPINTSSATSKVPCGERPAFRRPAPRVHFEGASTPVRLALKARLLLLP